MSLQTKFEKLSAFGMFLLIAILLIPTAGILCAAVVIGFILTLAS